MLPKTLGLYTDEVTGDHVISGVVVVDRVERSIKAASNSPRVSHSGGHRTSRICKVTPSRSTILGSTRSVSMCSRSNGSMDGG